MSAACIPIIFLFLAFFIVTRPILIKIKKDSTLSLELHFPIFALHLQSKEGSTKKRKKKQKRRFSSYINILSALDRLIRGSEITLKRVTVPTGAREAATGEMPRVFGYYSIVSALLAYLDDRASSLNVSDDAFVFGGESFCFDLSLKTRLFNLILGLFKILVIDKAKGGRKKYVR